MRLFCGAVARWFDFKKTTFAKIRVTCGGDQLIGLERLCRACVCGSDLSVAVWALPPVPPALMPALYGLFITYCFHRDMVATAKYGSP